MKIGYVCTNYNNSAYTREAVSSLCRNGEDRYRIVVVDNHSDEQSVETLRRIARGCQHVELILNKENVGYFKGLNMGIRRLRSAQPDMNVIVVGNNDLVFPPDFAESIGSNLARLEEYAVVSPDIVTLDGVHQNPHVIRKIGKFREFMYSLYYANYYLGTAIRKLANAGRGFTGRWDTSQHEIAREIYAGLGACYVLGPVFFRHFEELWAPTFLMNEEKFLSKQLSDKGLHIYYEPSIRILHHNHAARSALGEKATWRAARDAHKIYRRHVKIFS
ncbi:MAG: glycosyltransferase [Candidatus Acidiferrales bacterium]